MTSWKRNIETETESPPFNPPIIGLLFLPISNILRGFYFDLIISNAIETKNFYYNILLKVNDAHTSTQNYYFQAYFYCVFDTLQ